MVLWVRQSSIRRYHETTKLRDHKTAGYGWYAMNSCGAGLQGAILRDCEVCPSLIANLLCPGPSDKLFLFISGATTLLIFNRPYLLIQKSILGLPYTVGKLVPGTMQWRGSNLALSAHVPWKMASKFTFGNFDQLKTHNAVSDNMHSDKIVIELPHGSLKCWYFSEYRFPHFSHCGNCTLLLKLFFLLHGSTQVLCHLFILGQQELKILA